MASLSKLNAMDCRTFTDALAHVFEHSPWIPEQTWPQRPFATVADLHRELCATMHAAEHAQQLELIRAHPDLAGRLAHQQQLTADSAREQAAAGLARLTADEQAEFQRLNGAYRQRFGFPFVICARLNQKAAILAAMRDRLNNTPGQEFDTALAEIEKIAALRLESLLGAGAPGATGP